MSIGYPKRLSVCHSEDSEENLVTVAKLLPGAVTTKNLYNSCYIYTTDFQYSGTILLTYSNFKYAFLFQVSFSLYERSRKFSFKSDKAHLTPECAPRIRPLAVNVETQPCCSVIDILSTLELSILSRNFNIALVIKLSTQFPRIIHSAAGKTTNGSHECALSSTNN